MPIKTFRMQLAGVNAGTQKTIRLKRIDGKTGYRIKSISCIQKSPGAADNEGLIQIWSVKRTTAEVSIKTIDIEDATLLGVVYVSSDVSSDLMPEDKTIIFDEVVFNQDIFVTYIDVRGINDPMNVELQLEQIRLDDVEATTVILKNFRNTNTVA